MRRVVWVGKNLLTINKVEGAQTGILVGAAAASSASASSSLGIAEEDSYSTSNNSSPRDVVRRAFDRLFGYPEEDIFALFASSSRGVSNDNYEDGIMHLR